MRVEQHCSFCGKRERDVKRLIAGPAVTICDECIGLCNDIIAEQAAAEAGPKDIAAKAEPAPPTPGGTCALCGTYQRLGGRLFHGNSKVCDWCVASAARVLAAERAADAYPAPLPGLERKQAALRALYRVREEHLDGLRLPDAFHAKLAEAIAVLARDAGSRLPGKYTGGPPPGYEAMRPPYKGVLDDNQITGLKLIEFEEEYGQGHYAPIGVDRAIWQFLHDSHRPDRPPLREYLAPFLDPEC